MNKQERSSDVPFDIQKYLVDCMRNLIISYLLQIRCIVDRGDKISGV
jgi:hypothetical protein